MYSVIILTTLVVLSIIVIDIWSGDFKKRINRHGLLVAFGEGSRNIIVGTIVSFAAFSFLWIFVTALASIFVPKDSDLKAVRVVDLVSLNDRFSNETDSFLFLGTGNIKSKEESYYYYYYRDDDDGIRQSKVNTKGAVIYETDGSPYLVTKKQCTEILIKEDSLLYKFFYFNLFGCDPYEYHYFYVPHGSVVEKYTLDLE